LRILVIQMRHERDPSGRARSAIVPVANRYRNAVEAHRRTLPVRRSRTSSGGSRSVQPRQAVVPPLHGLHRRKAVSEQPRRIARPFGTETGLRRKTVGLFRMPTAPQIRTARPFRPGAAPQRRAAPANPAAAGSMFMGGVRPKRGRTTDIATADVGRRNQPAPRCATTGGMTTGGMGDASTLHRMRVRKRTGSPTSPTVA
jgi:hypothetical protein